MRSWPGSYTAEWYESSGPVVEISVHDADASASAQVSVVPQLVPLHPPCSTARSRTGSYTTVLPRGILFDVSTVHVNGAAASDSTRTLSAKTTSRSRTGS